MARIPETNKRFRTKDEIARDLAYVLKAPLAYGTKFAVMKDVSWVWTEFDGKYQGCKWWSKTAFELKSREPKTKLLRHEHAIPRKVVFELLMRLKRPTPKSVKRICEKFLIGVVLTKTEDDKLNAKFRSSMPEPFFDPQSPRYRDPWLRYKRCKIRLVQVCSKANDASL